MNKWIQKSITLANSPGYLDKLQEVYPVTIETVRPLDLTIKAALKEAYERRDNLRLIKTLLSLDKFPVKDPYVAFLRKDDKFLGYNPQTVRRIAERIRTGGFDEMIKGIEEPKEFNRQIGTLFKKYLPKMGYPILPLEEFESHRGIALLKGSEADLEDYANDKLGCRLKKEPDLLAKAGKHYIIGEAKFLTDVGGHQNAQFADALTLLKSRAGRAIRVAVLDGVVWIKGGSKMYKQVCRLDKPALTALLLKEFLQSLE